MMVKKLVVVVVLVGVMVVVAGGEAAAATSVVVVAVRVVTADRSGPLLYLQPPVRGGGTIALRVVRVLRGRQPSSQSSE
uniref:Putative secreted peptide n=1 Tax=Anopheles braziliensis TaxID=58242 RepID=A0A2M3ZNF0_9DIPT